MLVVRRLRRSKKWVLLGIPDFRRRWYGPYETKQEAEEDQTGLQDFYARHPEMIRDDAKLLQNLIEKTREAMEHLRPETVEWFKTRMAWLLYCIENGEEITE